MHGRKVRSTSSGRSDRTAFPEILEAADKSAAAKRNDGIGVVHALHERSLDK
jgi:hypothetical protein